ncbi:PREDICTED: ras-related protein Rab-3-like [Amphimedon queenslandica]|nr:PREDICTED: ras-related protein Rab-3-like [Amphimedon queenslandica]|eukprot:XP_003389854.1 PREDICTED: ras-related protein Rab-3-like [Amphimedon queenslandica]
MQKGEDETLDSVMDVNFDYMYKILMVGNSGVGKTAYVSRYCDDHFNPAFISTVGIDFRVKNLIRNQKRIKLQIWDTAGQERYQAITTAYYHGAMGFIVMFDLTSEDTFSACRMWIQQIKEMALENAIILLIGNKVDLTAQRQVSTESIEEFTDSLGIHFFETSAKENTNIKESAEYLVDAITQKMSETIEKNPNFTPRGVKPRETAVANEKPSGSCGC